MKIMRKLIEVCYISILNMLLNIDCTIFPVSLYDKTFTCQQIQRRIQHSVRYLRWNFLQIEECFTAGSYFLNSSILGVWVAKYFSEVRFSRIIFNEATCNNTQRCLLFKTFSIDLTRLNSIFPIVAAAVRYTLKSINSCIRA